MKTCPACQTKNEENASFCKNCGYKFTNNSSSTSIKKENSVEGESRIDSKQQKNNANKNPLLIGGIIALVGIALGLTFYFTSVLRQPTTNLNAARSESSTSFSQNAATSSTNEKVDLTKYDGIIAEAKKLTIDEKFKESSLKLATIPVSDLSKDEFAPIRDSVETLNKENAEGMKAQTAKEAAENSKNNQVKESSGFVGDFAKWSNTYFFYFSQDNQKQSSLTISANGGVTQNNYDGTQYFGSATIASSNESKLSYATNEMYPFYMPETKTINSNVAITVTWDNSGESQVFYGYLSYSSRLALTDGVPKGNGVNEVWLSY